MGGRPEPAPAQPSRSTMALLVPRGAAARSCALLMAGVLALSAPASASPALRAGLAPAVRGCRGGSVGGGCAGAPVLRALRGGDAAPAQWDNLFKHTDREANVQMAKFAEQAERYEEMMQATRAIAEMGVELTVEERSLLSVAYKNVVGSKRSSWKTISAMEQKQTDEKTKALIQSYLHKVERELSDVCHEIIGLLDQYLIPNAKDAEPKVFYLKMHGDYWRYLAEVSGTSQRAEAAERALQAYKAAQELAVKHLSTTHPIRLGLALNFSVFFFEILNMPNDACTLARQAFDDSCKDLDHLNEESYKDATLIMQLLRDNLTLWTSDTNAAYTGPAEGAAPA